VILTGVFASLIVGSHQLSLAYVTPLLPILVGALLLLNRQALLGNLKPAASVVAVATVFSLPYVPIYLRLLGWAASTSSPAAVSTAPLEKVGTELLYLPYIWGLVLAVPAAVIALRWTWRRDRNMAVAIAVMFGYSLVLSLFLLPPPFAELNRRAHFFMYAPLWLVIAVVVSQLWAWRTKLWSGRIRWLPKLSAVAIVAAMLSSNMVLSQRQMTSGLDYYGYLNEHRWDAIQWIREKTPEDALIATYPESLGWWIQAEAGRRVANVTDRNMAPYPLLGERSLTAERLLSRNVGLHNGKLLVAVTWPYDDAPGDPVLAAYVGGFYQHILMFDDRQTFLTQGSSTAALADVVDREISTIGNSESMQVVASCQVLDVQLVQTVSLDRDSQSATVSYTLRNLGSAPVHLDVPLLFCVEPDSALTDTDLNSIDIVQNLETPFDGIVAVNTRLTMLPTGVTAEFTNYPDQSFNLSFDMQATDASITFKVAITAPQIANGTDVMYYDVPEVIRDASVDYIVVDRSPDSPAWSDLPRGLVQWLDACPYYERIYPLDGIGEIMIYQVDTSALP
jgi:hypothetical protein